MREISRLVAAIGLRVRWRGDLAGDSGHRGNQGPVAARDAVESASAPSPDGVDRVTERLAVYTEREYCSDGVNRYGKEAFVLFLEALRQHIDGLVLVGRMDPRPGRSYYPLSQDTELVGLPHYKSFTHPWSVARSLVLSLVRLWRLLDRVQTVWVLGPYPHALACALLTALRRRRLVLGVRQDTYVYIRSRRPDRRWMHVSADLLEGIWKLLARRYAIVVVGSELERKYRSSRARSVLATPVSLVSGHDVALGADAAAARDYSGELTLLTVGRLDAEKNPLLLADIMARLLAGERRWRLRVCGEGPMLPELRARLAQLAVLDRVELLGYVPIDRGLLDLYRSSHAFLHVSWTEGFPQVLLEAFAAGLPTVATAVGGMQLTARDAALLVKPDDAAMAALALERIASDGELRDRLIETGLERAREDTIEVVSERVAAFLGSSP